MAGRCSKKNVFTELNPNKVNDFFANLGPSAVDNLAQPPFHHAKFVKPVSNSFHLTELTLTELSNIVSSLANKSSSGFDGLSTKNLKLIFPYIASALLKIINKSFISGVFPDILKIARVIPLHKGGDIGNLINFRPISLLSSVSKVFERAMFNKMLSFINKYHILSDSQFGFRKNHNTELAVLHALNYITKSLDNNTPVLGLFIDVAKAFDSLDHNVLLDKLYLLGFRGASHSWLASFLSNRFQYVEITGAKSNMRKLCKGVPQGSILGPLLFLLYINDLTYVSTKLHFTLFADDTTVLFADDSLKSSFDVASCELRIVFDWFIANRLCLNVVKTHFMLFATGCLCADVSLNVANIVVKKVQSIKFLGVYIDERLCWHEHVNMLYTKLSKSLGLLKAASVYLPRNILLSMFYAFFNSQLLYGLLIWGNTYSTYLMPINVLYKRCLRLLSCAPLLAHTPPLALQLGLLIFDDLLTYHTAVFMFKLTNNMLPLCISSMFTRLRGTTRRNAYDYFVPRVNLDICKRFISFFGVNVWLQMSNNIKCVNKLDIFKQLCFNNLSEKYSVI